MDKSHSTQTRLKDPFDPKTTKLLGFRDAVPQFLEGNDSPRAYLERCLDTIERREPTVGAFAFLNVEGARKAADAASARYKTGRTLSRVDGMPFGVKDLYETADMPAQMNSSIYKGWRSIRDCAHVFAMREGGAVIVGKTTTTEFGMAAPPPTRNPFDTGRTAGGSSSGSSAAVGARMLPAASGSQARGSIVRPAGYCGNYALKPTYGAINRGGGHSMTPSNSVLGVHAGTLKDMWETAFHIAYTIGGDAGMPGLFGEPDLPAARRPERVIHLETLGWRVTEDKAKSIFLAFLEELRKQQVTVFTRADDPRIEAVEQALERLPEFFFPMLGYDSRWPGRFYRDNWPGELSDTLLGYLKFGDNLTPDDYRKALRQRSELRDLFARIKELAPVCLAPVQAGPAPEGMGIGDPVYGDVTSALGSPAVVLPIMAIDEMPFAMQVMTQQHEDYEATAYGRWIAEWWLER